MERWRVRDGNDVTLGYITAGGFWEADRLMQAGIAAGTWSEEDDPGVDPESVESRETMEREGEYPGDK